MSNIIPLPRRITPSNAVNSRGSVAPGLSPVAFLKRSELTQTFIDCFAMGIWIAFWSLIGLATLFAVGVLVFEATLGRH